MLCVVNNSQYRGGINWARHYCILLFSTTIQQNIVCSTMFSSEITVFFVSSLLVLHVSSESSSPANRPKQ